LRQHELKQRNDEKLERERLLKLEQTLIRELREKLMALLNEQAGYADVREMDVRESEQIDKQVNLALLNTQQQADEVKQEAIEGSVVIEDVEMSEEVKVDEINVEMED